MGRNPIRRKERALAYGGSDGKFREVVGDDRTHQGDHSDERKKTGAKDWGDPQSRCRTEGRKRATHLSSKGKRRGTKENNCSQAENKRKRRERLLS
jgi:hypothetical protein